MIEIIGTELNQWDSGRYVQVTGIEASQVHFANTGDSKAVIMVLADSQAKIPDYLLQTGKQLCVYAYANGVTVESKTFSVRKRERPESYVYDEDQRNYIYRLIQSAEVATETAYQAAEAANQAAQDILDMKAALTPRISSVTLPASAWVGSGSLYSQVVTIDGITEYSKVDLLPSVEQLAIFHEKDVAFVTENEDGVVTVYAIGDKPTLDYTMQAQITEVAV